MLRRIEHRRHPRTSPLILPKFSSLQGSIALQCQIFKIRPLLITIRLKPCLHNENLALGAAIGYSFQGCLKNPKIGYLYLSLVRGCMWVYRSLHKVLKLKYGKPDDTCGLPCRRTSAHTSFSSLRAAYCVGCTKSMRVQQYYYSNFAKTKWLQYFNSKLAQLASKTSHNAFSSTNSLFHALWMKL